MRSRPCCLRAGSVEAGFRPARGGPADSASLECLAAGKLVGGTGLAVGRECQRTVLEALRRPALLDGSRYHHLGAARGGPHDGSLLEVLEAAAVPQATDGAAGGVAQRSALKACGGPLVADRCR